MSVAVVTGARAADGMGLETAELRLIEALRARASFSLRAVGRRGALRYARRVGAGWAPLPSLAWRGAELVHLLGLDVPPPERVPFVATFYDLSPLHFDDEGELPPWAAETAARAERIVTPSEFTAGQLVRDLGVPRERIDVVGQGPGHAPAEPLTDGELAGLNLARPLVVRLGGYTRRKNVPLLLDAWPEVRRRTGATLALAGPPQAARHAQLAAAPSLEGVRPLDYLPAALVPRLVAAADALVSTSLYEGFGLPPLEAMAAGTPVVAVRAPFVEEVCGDAAALAENDPGSVAEALVAVLADGAPGLVEAGRLRARRFTWDAAAERVLAAWSAAGARSRAAA